MNLTPEQLEQVEQLAYRLLSPSEIAIIIEVNALDLSEEIHTEGTPGYCAFYKGYLKQVVEMRDAVIKAAQNGSNPAQEEMMKYMQLLENRLRYG